MGLSSEVRAFLWDCALQPAGLTPAPRRQCQDGVVWRIELVAGVEEFHTFGVRSTGSKNNSERVFQTKGLGNMQGMWETKAWLGWALEEIQLDS